jgi:3-phosphoshikimate 1-carboxyvinyltransferase
VNFQIEPSTIAGGEVNVPGDKSISHRALMLGAVAEGRTVVTGFLPGDDCLATATALRALGVKIVQPVETMVQIDGVGLHGLSAAAGDIDLGNSGTAMRLLTGLLSGQQFTSCLTGDESLQKRPMNRIIKPLTLMGAHIESSEGRAPLNIVGGQELTGITYALPVASAQVKSSVLLAGLYADRETTILEPAITRDHTERMLESMGVKLHLAERRITMQGGQQPKGCEFEVPSDLSSATFMMVATLISSSGQTRIANVGVNPTRTGVIEILRSMGGNISLENARLAGTEPVADIVVKASYLRGIDMDPTMVSLAIDEFPAIFIAAAAAVGVTRFSGLGELRLKESDRISTMVNGLKSLNADIVETEDGATIIGGRFTGGKVEAAGDHRVAMAFAVAGSVAEGPVEILGVDNVDTSFPNFVERMRDLGVDITAVESGINAG